MIRIKHQPDIEELYKVLRREKTDRPCLCEFFMHNNVVQRLADEQYRNPPDLLSYGKMLISGYKNAGYHHVTIPVWEFGTMKFVKDEVHQKESKSLNEGSVIRDRQSFEQYNWPDPEKADFSIYERIKPELPDGMKVLGLSHGGVLENVMELVGFENLCMLSLMDEELTMEIFAAVGSHLLRFFEILVQFESVGLCVVNDDWGFKTQTMLSPDAMRKYVIPWHKRIVEAVHKAGKPAILHSCGNLKEVMDDVIDDIGFDGKHSYEDEITPVEEAYDLWGDRIAIIGGIDMNFLATASIDQIKERSRNMIIKTMDKGGYALGSGNSIPEFIPFEHYLAMTSVVREFDE